MPVELPARYAGVPMDGQQVRQLGRDFRSEELSGLLNEAFAGNMDMRAAWARVRQAEAAALESRAGLLPTLGTGAEATRARIPLTGAAALGRPLQGGAIGTGSSALPATPNFSRQPMATRQPPSPPTPEPPTAVTQNQLNLSLGASYELDLWGRLLKAHRADRLDAAAVRRDADSLAITLAARVTETWANLAAQHEREAIIRRQGEASAQFLRVARVRFEQGLTSAIDVAQQEQQEESVRGLLRLAEADTIIQANQLALLVGRVPTSCFTLRQRQLPPLPPLPRVGVPADLLLRRPDLQGAMLRLQAADQRTASAVASMLPRIRISANVFAQAEELSKLFDEAFGNLSGSLQQEAFTGGRRRAAVRRAEAVAEEQRYHYRRTLLESLREVQETISLETKQRAYLDSLRRQLESAELALDLGVRQYQRGAVDYLQVLTLLQTQQAVELDVLDARRQLYSVRMQLWRALGGGWR